MSLAAAVRSTAFREGVHARDLDAVMATFAAAPRFWSPAVFTPYEGRDAIRQLLGFVMETFEDFEYVDALAGDADTEALVFRARVGDKQLQGLDHLRFDAEGLITELTVMIRPLSGTIALAQAMGAKLAAAAPAES